ncbi:MAG: 1-acyl-sn-glycerol-3-phosphate acyltransferase [Bdellovibrionaceae bacterium]|nr:1-acyl-sn-glycerol-3-phosphate acyltransferase [Pseudobdellovibrionaceae bacterium]
MIVLIRLRSLILVMLYPIYLVLLSFICVVLNLIFNNRKIDNFMIKIWAKGSCRMFGVRVSVNGEENIPKKIGCIYIFNHASYFDIWAMSGYLPSFRFGSKIELFRIPIFGWALRRVGVLPIDRERRESVFRVYAEAKERILIGDRFALAPEGTRQGREGQLGPFKSGPFVLAIQCGAPLVPVIIRNAGRVMPKDKIFPNWNRWSDEIILDVLPSIETRHLEVDAKKELMESTRMQMQKAVDGLRSSGLKS